MFSDSIPMQKTFFQHTNMVDIVDIMDILDMATCWTWWTLDRLNANSQKCQVG